MVQWQRIGLATVAAVLLALRGRDLFSGSWVKPEPHQWRGVLPTKPNHTDGPLPLAEESAAQLQQELASAEAEVSGLQAQVRTLRGVADKQRGQLDVLEMEKVCPVAASSVSASD